MASGNPNIPLSVAQRDFSSPLLKLQETARQNKIDAANLKTTEQQQAINEQTIATNQQALDKATASAIAMDTIAAADLLKAGKSKQAGALLIHNIDKMEAVGIDTTDVRRIATLAATRPELATKYMDEHMLPTMRAMMPDLFKPTTINPNEVTDSGQVLTKDRAGNVTATDVAGFKQPEANPVNNSLLQSVGPDGKITPIQYNPRGAGFLTMDNQPFELPEGAVVTRPGSPTGPMKDVIPANREVDRRRQEGAVRSFNDAAGRAIELITQNPDANTFVANLATAGAGLMQEAGAIARFAGIDRETFDPAQYTDVFKDLNIDNAALQSVITSLAFQAAAAKNVSGSGVSNRDVERFIRQVGGNYSDPQSMLAALQETVREVNSSYANDYQSLYGEPFSGDLGIPQFPNSRPTIQAPSGNAYTIEEVQ
jgi:hypothetical protein